MQVQPFVMILLNKNNIDQLSRNLKFAIGLFLMLCTTSLMAQTPIGLGDDMASPNSVVHMGNQGGLIIPKVSLTNSTVFLTGKTATATDESMLVFNTSSSTANGLKGRGFYYWIDNAWSRFYNHDDTFPSTRVNLHPNGETENPDFSGWTYSGSVDRDATTAACSPCSITSGSAIANSAMSKRGFKTCSWDVGMVSVPQSSVSFQLNLSKFAGVKTSINKLRIFLYGDQDGADDIAKYRIRIQARNGTDAFTTLYDSNEFTVIHNNVTDRSCPHSEALHEIDRGVARYDFSNYYEQWRIIVDALPDGNSGPYVGVPQIIFKEVYSNE